MLAAVEALLGRRLGVPFPMSPEGYSPSRRRQPREGAALLFWPGL